MFHIIFENNAFTEQCESVWKYRAEIRFGLDSWIFCINNFFKRVCLLSWLLAWSFYSSESRYSENAVPGDLLRNATKSSGKRARVIDSPQVGQMGRTRKKEYHTSVPSEEERVNEKKKKKIEREREKQQKEQQQALLAPTPTDCSSIMHLGRWAKRRVILVTTRLDLTHNWICHFSCKFFSSF